MTELHYTSAVSYAGCCELRNQRKHLAEQIRCTSLRLAWSQARLNPPPAVGLGTHVGVAAEAI